MSTAWWHRFSAPTTYNPVIASDGIRSSVRQHLFGDQFAPRDTGYACWRMAVPRPPDLTQSEYWNRPAVIATVIHPNQDLMYLLVVERVEPGSTPDRSRMPEQLRECLTGFGGLIGAIRDSISESSDIHWAPLQEVVLPAPRYEGRIVLTGDAAHAVTPHLRRAPEWRWRTLSCSPTNSAKTAAYRRRSPLSWPGDYRECSSYSTRPTKSC